MSLPEKATLTLGEVIARWRHWGCDYETLHGYAQQDLLVFSVYLIEIGGHRSVRTEADTQITREVQAMKFANSDHVTRGLFYLDGDDSRKVLEAKESEQIAVNALYWTPDRIKKLGTYHAPAKFFTPQDLVVTREECERFEKRYRATGSSDIFKRVSFWIKEPSEHKTLKLILGAVATIVAAGWAAFTWFYR